jgi:hypothetical protein
MYWQYISACFWWLLNGVIVTGQWSPDVSRPWSELNCQQLKINFLQTKTSCTSPQSLCLSSCSVFSLSLILALFSLYLWFFLVPLLSFFNFTLWFLALFFFSNCTNLRSFSCFTINLDSFYVSFFVLCSFFNSCLCLHFSFCFAFQP